VFQCVAVCCSCIAMCCSNLEENKCVSACCSVLQLCCNVLQCGALRCSVVQCGAVWCSILLCVVVCCRGTRKKRVYIRGVLVCIHRRSVYVYVVCIHISIHTYIHTFYYIVWARRQESSARQKKRGRKECFCRMRVRYMYACIDVCMCA